MYYVKIESWHIVMEEDGGDETLCGLTHDPDAEMDFQLPLTEKSCETCLRLSTRADADEA